MSLAWGARVSAEFRRRVIAICADFGIADPSWLMACMAFETGRTFSASIENPKSGATGLIQFMPRTARGMGTTVEALARKTAEEQLDDVRRYFAPHAGKIRTLADCYMAILWPAAVGTPDDFVLFSAGEAYAQNKGLDVDPDGAGPLEPDHKVTKYEAASFIRAALAEGLKPENASEIADQPQGEHDMPGLSGAINAAAGLAGAVNPMAGLVLGLAGSLMDAFSPLAKDKIAKEVNRHTDDPNIGASVASAVVDIAKNITGHDDPVAAVAAVKASPELVAQVEQQTIAKLDELAPFLDKLADYQRQEWDATETSMDRAQARVTAGGWDMAPHLVMWALACGTLILVALLALACIYALKGMALPEMLLTLIVQTVTGVLGFVALLFAFRFGTSKSSGAKDELVAQLASRRPK